MGVLLDVSHHWLIVIVETYSFAHPPLQFYSCINANNVFDIHLAITTVLGHDFRGSGRGQVGKKWTRRRLYAD